MWTQIFREWAGILLCSFIGSNLGGEKITISFWESRKPSAHRYKLGGGWSSYLKGQLHEIEHFNFGVFRYVHGSRFHLREKIHNKDANLKL